MSGTVLGPGGCSDKPADVGPVPLALTDLRREGLYGEKCLEKVTFKLRAGVERRSTQGKGR